MSAGPPPAEPGWLGLREPADHRARSVALVRTLAEHLPPGPRQILDLGAGTGSTTRWLAPLLSGPQEWTLLDRDADLLALVPARTAGVLDADGEPVAVTPRVAELAEITPIDLATAGLVTGSALLDVLTAAEVDELAAACAAARVPVLLTLTVTGQVEIDPPEPYDAEVAAAFDAHQQRTVAGRTLLGPAAGPAAESAFRRHGMAVTTASTPWRLDADDADLVRRWLTERVAAAVEQNPALRTSAQEALPRRVNAAPLRAVISHVDLLALPIGGAP